MDYQQLRKIKTFFFSSLIKKKAKKKSSLPDIFAAFQSERIRRKCNLKLSRQVLIAF